MWIFTEIADAFDKIRKDDDRILDEVFQDWVSYALKHEDDPVWYSALRNAGIYTGTGLLYGSWKLSSGVASGFVDTLRIGDGVKKGGWGYAEDTLRLLVVAGPALRSARFGLSMLASIDTFPASGVCSWVAAAKALRFTGVSHFATVADLAKAVGVTGDLFPAVYGISEITNIIKKMGGLTRALAPISSDITTSLLAATEQNPNGIVMFAVEWMQGSNKVGHALLATRNVVTGALQILDRSGRVVSSIAELGDIYSGIASASFKAADTMAFIVNSTTATAIELLSKGSAVLQSQQKVFDSSIPEEAQLIKTYGIDAAHDVSGLVGAIGLEVRSIPFRAQTGRRVHVPAKPIVAEASKETVSSTVCVDGAGAFTNDEAGPPKKTCVTTTYEYQIYKVQSGDSLVMISKKFYGTENLWKLVYQSNKELIGPDPHAPTALRAGMDLHILMSSKKSETAGAVSP